MRFKLAGPMDDPQILDHFYFPLTESPHRQILTILPLRGHMWTSASFRTLFCAALALSLG